MTILEELNTLLKSTGIPVETGYFTGKPPETYLVLTPLTDIYSRHADNRPQADIQEVRISLFTTKNYTPAKTRILRILLDADFTMTDRRYLGWDTEAGYHGYSIDVQKHYELEEQ